MIYIRVELRPGGYQHHDRQCVLAEAEIWNDGGTRTKGEYCYRLFGKDRRLMREGRVTGYMRLRDHTWKLIRLVLFDAWRP